MGLKLNAQNVAAEAQAGVNGGDKPKRPSSVHWVNVGVDANIKHEDGTSDVQFVGLALGIPMDYQEEATAGANSSYEWKQIAAIRNAICKMLKDGAGALEPGQRDYVDGLRVQIAKAGVKEAASADNVPGLEDVLSGIKIGSGKAA